MKSELRKKEKKHTTNPYPPKKNPTKTNQTQTQKLINKRKPNPRKISCESILDSRLWGWDDDDATWRVFCSNLGRNPSSLYQVVLQLEVPSSIWILWIPPHFSSQASRPDLYPNRCLENGCRMLSLLSSAGQPRASAVAFILTLQRLIPSFPMVK